MRNIQLSESTAKEWINKGGELKEIALQAYPELKRATKWEDCKGQNGYFFTTFSEFRMSQINSHTDKSSFATENQAKAVLALAQLTQLYWNWYGKPMPLILTDCETNFLNTFFDLIQEYLNFDKI